MTLYKVIACKCHWLQLSTARTINQLVAAKCQRCGRLYKAKPQWVTSDFAEAQRVLRGLREKGMTKEFGRAISKA